MKSSLSQSQASPTGSTLPPASSPSSDHAHNRSSPDSGIAMGSQSFCSGDSVSPPSQVPADSTSVFPPSSVSMVNPSVQEAKRRAHSRSHSVPHLSSRGVNMVHISGQPSSLTPPPNMMAPYTAAAMSGPYYPLHRSQRPAANLSLSHAPTDYHSVPAAYSNGYSTYTGNTHTHMSSQICPPSYNFSPSYYNHGMPTQYPNGNTLASDPNSYLAYPEPQQPTSAVLLPPSNRQGYQNIGQTDSLFPNKYSPSSSSPSSSTHSETATSQMESTIKELVTSVAMTSTPTTFASPDVPKQQSPHAAATDEGLESMEVDTNAVPDLGNLPAVKEEKLKAEEKEVVEKKEEEKEEKEEEEREKEEKDKMEDQLVFTMRCVC